MAVTGKGKIVKLEDILNTTKTKTDDTQLKKSAKAKSVIKKPEIVVPKGKPKSGRVWKNEKKRFSSIVKTRGIRNSFEKKQKLRQDLKRVKEASRAAKEARVAAKELKKERRRENLRRQEENRKKSEVVQVITNTSKIKKMRKKQLRYIEKRDTTTVG